MSRVGFFSYRNQHRKTWDPEKFTSTSKDNKERLKIELVGNVKTRIVLYVGRLHPEKDVTTLIHAFRTVSERLNHTLLLIIGSGPQEHSLKALVRELDIEDKVNFLGYVHNDYLPSYYQVSDVYVLCSLREEWSNTIMEAMASGVPVIASNVLANYHLVRHGETGFLVSTREPAQLAETICYVLENLGDIRGIISKARAQMKKYDQVRVGSQYKTVILNLIQDISPPSWTIP